MKLNPEVVLIDFEKAAQNAYEHHFPNVRLIGCFFHFGQALFKYLKDECKLSSEYQANDDLKMWFKSVNALALLPPGKVAEAWVNLDDTRPEYANIEQFCNYFVEIWLEGRFQIDLWNQWTNHIRTNNHIEGVKL